MGGAFRRRATRRPTRARLTRKLLNQLDRSLSGDAIEPATELQPNAKPDGGSCHPARRKPHRVVPTKTESQDRP